MDVLFGFAFLGMMAWAVIGMARPRWAKLPDRYIAGILLMASFLPVAAAIEFAPAEGQTPQAGSLLTWAILTGGVAAILLAVRKSKAGERRSEEMQAFFRPAAPPPSPVPAPTPKPSVLEEIAAIKRMKTATVPPKPAPTKSPVRVIAPPRRAKGGVFMLGDGEWGDSASFSYVDAEGRHSERMIYDWHSDGIYVRGICAIANESRTFRKDRMTDWLIH